MSLFIIFTNIYIITSTRKYVSSKVQDLQSAEIALVLGTSKSTQQGTTNLFFKDRIKAAAALYHSGKVKHVILSGDNRTQYYNEPQDMLEALMKLEVPTEAVTLDNAGLRTLDSVVRCKEVFDQTDIIIVTQSFHAYRAIFIAKGYDIQAQAFSANFESYTYKRLVFREVIARSLAFLDVFVWNRSPRYLGEKEPLVIGG